MPDSPEDHRSHSLNSSGNQKKSGMYNMIRSRIESNPRLLNLSRQTNPNPRGPEYVAEEVESNDPDSHSMSQIETNSMERLSRRQKYEKN